MNNSNVVAVTPLEPKLMLLGTPAHMVPLDKHLLLKRKAFEFGSKCGESRADLTNILPKAVKTEVIVYDVVQSFSLDEDGLFCSVDIEHFGS
jgi:hypothetical protein